MTTPDIEHANPTYAARYVTGDGNFFEVAAWRGTRAGNLTEFGRVEIIINEIQKVTVTNPRDIDSLISLFRQGQNVALESHD